MTYDSVLSKYNDKSIKQHMSNSKSQPSSHPSSKPQGGQKFWAIWPQTP